MKPCGHGCNETVQGCAFCSLVRRRAEYRQHWCKGEAGSVPPPRQYVLSLPCVHGGDPLTGAERDAAGLGHLKRWQHCGHPQQPLGKFVCTCAGCGPKCPGYAAETEEQAMTDTTVPTVRWACGLTTVQQRRGDLLPRTLASLRAAGFPSPRLFVDGCTSGDASSYEREFQLEVTPRWPLIRPFGNWLLGLEELYVRDPHADRYAMFQDDLVACANLRDYLDSREVHPKSYWNLYTFPENQEKAPRTAKGGTMQGWYASNQKGKGAVALVFSADGAREMLCSKHTVSRPMDAERGWKAIDGGVVSAMRKAGYVELVHSPSLVQHTGTRSTMGNGRHPMAESFPGESFNALELLR